MTSYIEPYDLEIDEITFELGIRSMPPVITRFRIEALKERLLLEMRGEVDAPSKDFSGNVRNQIKTCLKKTKDLEVLLMLASDQPDKPEKILVLISRFNHVKFRLNLLSSEDEREKEWIKEILGKVLFYLDLLNSVREGKVVLKDTLNVDKFMSSDKNAGLSISSIEESEGEGARAVTPATINTGAIRKNFGINSRDNRTSSPKLDGGEDLSNLLDGLELGEGAGSLDDSLKERRLNRSAPNSLKGGPIYIPPHERVKRPTNIFRDPAILSTKPIYQRPQPNNERRYRDPHYEINPNEGNRYLPREPMYEPRGPMYHPQQNIPQQPIHAQQPRSSYRNPIPNWHLVYSGDGRGLSVNDFLKQVVFMARADRVGEQDLLESAIHLFSGSARSWYMAFEHTFDSWLTLTNSLRQQFISQDGDFGILKDIEQRQQQRDEPFIFYLSAMMNMFDQLQFPMPEQSRVSFVLRNMSSYLSEKLALVDITSLQQLSRLCKRIEDIRGRDKIKKTSLPDSSNFSHRARVSEIDHDDRYSLYPLSVPEKSVSFSKEVKCVNCRRNGHVHQECDRERMRIFCFKCGELGQTAFSCPTCNPSKLNTHRGSAQEYGGSFPQRN